MGGPRSPASSVGGGMPPGAPVQVCHCTSGVGATHSARCRALPGSAEERQPVLPPPTSPLGRAVSRTRSSLCMSSFRTSVRSRDRPHRPVTRLGTFVVAKSSRVSSMPEQTSSWRTLSARTSARHRRKCSGGTWPTRARSRSSSCSPVGHRRHAGRIRNHKRAQPGDGPVRLSWLRTLVLNWTPLGAAKAQQCASAAS